MRWLTFFIMTYVVLGIQSGLGALADIHGARPNVVLLSVIFIALWAPRDLGLLACFMLGLFQDMLTLQPLGVFAVAYALVGLYVTRLQDSVFRDRWLTHIFVGFTGALVCGLAVLGHGWVYPLFHRNEGWARPGVIPVFTGAIYNALLAPVALGLLQRTARLFGFRSRIPGSVHAIHSGAVKR